MNTPVIQNKRLPLGRCQPTILLDYAGSDASATPNNRFASRDAGSFEDAGSHKVGSIRFAGIHGYN